MKSTTAFTSLTILASLALGAPTIAARDEDCKQCELDGHKLWDMVHAEPSAPGTCNILFHSYQHCNFGVCDPPQMVWGFTGTHGDNLIAGATQAMHGILKPKYTAHAWDTYGGNLYLGLPQLKEPDISGFTAQYEHNGGRDEYDITSAHCRRRDVGDHAFGFQCIISC